MSTPGQVAFTPDGSQLVVTTKANGSSIDVFGVHFDGRLSSAPVVNAEPGAVPFAVDFDAAGHLVVTEAGTQRGRDVLAREQRDDHADRHQAHLAGGDLLDRPGQRRVLRLERG